MRHGRGFRRPAVAGAAALLAGCAALTGCSDAGSGDGAVSQAADRKAVTDAREGRQEGPPAAAERGAAQDAPADAAGQRPAEAPDPVRSSIVRTASLTIETGDVPGALEEARTAAEAAGGYVGDESTDRDAEGHDRSRMTLRVPPGEYRDVLTELSGLGEQVERKETAKDVTDQVVDVESRIKTQQASVARVRELMDRASELSDVVTLESELSTRQAELESLQARLKSLEERTGMATVTLVLREPEAAPAGKDEGTTVGDALAGGWDAFVATLRWIVIVLGAALPFAAALALLALGWRLLGGRFRPRGAVPPAPVTAPAPLGSSGPVPAGTGDGDGGDGDGGSGDGGSAAAPARP
ncbi:DUF4349 domain-containing protein [Streptomyces sp. JJ36]|uniref:DUF4349 domain-containing protein n=1 Tax=Streptomyces sp. JJ36 TaxID=2736645 RepID=UPI001F1CD821|nr:DUF4349 domain-containing protein [Streptomyces sp. JJ36]MCF6522752.1 DUF4349 domain-containing protein [Streptomyces sp. JJ36]